jgi:HSP20 family protein
LTGHVADLPSGAVTRPAHGEPDIDDLKGAATMTMLMEPLAPWLRDLNRFISSEAVPAAFIPPADVVVTEDGVAVFMDVPGLTRDDIEIDLENDTLTIRGERRPPEHLTGGGERAWRHVERRFGRFERTLRVPGGMNPDAVEASLADGVLTLRVPRPQSQRPHRVQIQGDRRSVDLGAGEAGAGSTAGAGGTADAGAGGSGTPAQQESPATGS